MHQSEIDLRKFHSTLSHVIGFFGPHLKSPSFVRDFLNYFFQVGDFLSSLWREFQFFPTTLGFLNCWGSVGSFCFFEEVSNFRW